MMRTLPKSDPKRHQEVRINTYTSYKYTDMLPEIIEKESEKVMMAYALTNNVRELPLNAHVHSLDKRTSNYNVYQI